MPSTYTSIEAYEKQANDENSDTWGERLNANWALIDRSRQETVTINHAVSVTLTMGATPSLVAQSGTTWDARYGMYMINGSASADMHLHVPAVSKYYNFNVNLTGNAESMIVSVIGGNAVTLGQDENATIYVKNGTTPIRMGDGVKDLNVKTLSVSALAADTAVIDEASLGWLENVSIGTSVTAQGLYNQGGQWKAIKPEIAVFTMGNAQLSKVTASSDVTIGANETWDRNGNFNKSASPADTISVSTAVGGIYEIIFRFAVSAPATINYQMVPLINGTTVTPWEGSNDLTQQHTGRLVWGYTVWATLANGGTIRVAQKKNSGDAGGRINNATTLIRRIVP